MKTWNHKWFSIFLLCYLFRNSHPKLFSKIAVLKFCKITLKTPMVDFCFNGRAYTFTLAEIELYSMLVFEFWISNFLKYLQLIVVIKSSQFCCGGSQENCIGSVRGKIIITILSLKVGTSENKNIDHWIKETCAQVIYEGRWQHLCTPPFKNIIFFMYFIVI